MVHRRQRPPCPITDAATADDVWIPEVASRRWLIITRDRRIAEHRAEVDAVRRSGARLVALAGREAKGTWAQLEVFMCQWRRIEQTWAETAPFIYLATRTAFVSVPLD